MKMSTFQAVSYEIEAAKVKYPSSKPDVRISGFMQESGEAMQAVSKWWMDPSEENKLKAREEIIHAIGQGFRLIEEVL